MSGRVFQNIVLQFKDAVDTEIGVIDAEGAVIACTDRQPLERACE